jgi:hypothetical protein
MWEFILAGKEDIYEAKLADCAVLVTHLKEKDRVSVEVLYHDMDANDFMMDIYPTKFGGWERKYHEVYVGDIPGPLIKVSALKDHLVRADILATFRSLPLEVRKAFHRYYNLIADKEEC